MLKIILISRVIVFLRRYPVDSFGQNPGIGFMLNLIKEIPYATDNRNRHNSGMDRKNQLDILAGDYCEN